ncbi:MAG: hypothetical protein ACYC1Z_14045 [Georgenia sp.]
MTGTGWFFSWGGILTAALMMAIPESARAQLATPLQGLSFGALMAGVPDRVTLQDSPRRAEISLTSTGTGSTQVDLRFILPTAMIHLPTGARLPLAFGTADAAVYDAKSGKVQLFDPAVGTSYRLRKNAVTVYLAGTALPGVAQRAGAYAASVTLLITNPAQ